MRIHLSQTSKMPCKSWGIPTSACKTGSKLKDAGLTPCSVCYAKLGKITMKKPQENLEENLKSYLESPEEWEKEMIDRLQKETPAFFRWFESGDIQSEKMLEKIIKITKRCKFTRFWLPTIEFEIVKKVIEKSRIPKNLTIRISSPKIDEIRIANLEGTQKSLVWWREKPESAKECEAYKNDGECGKCRSCWDKRIETIAYPLHRCSKVLPKKIGINGTIYKR